MWSWSHCHAGLCWCALHFTVPLLRVITGRLTKTGMMFMPAVLAPELRVADWHLVITQTIITQFSPLTHYRKEGEYNYSLGVPYLPSRVLHCYIGTNVDFQEVKNCSTVYYFPTWCLLGSLPQLCCTAILVQRIYYVLAGYPEWGVHITSGLVTAHLSLKMYSYICTRIWQYGELMSAHGCRHLELYFGG